MVLYGCDYAPGANRQTIFPGGGIGEGVMENRTEMIMGCSAGETACVHCLFVCLFTYPALVVTGATVQLMVHQQGTG